MGKILIIDDEESIQKYIGKLLAPLGYDVITASNSDAGLAMANDPDVKLIITDYRLPGTLEQAPLVKAIRELRPEVPLMVISGYADMDTISECEALGVRDVLTKPFELTFVPTVAEKMLAGVAR